MHDNIATERPVQRDEKRPPTGRELQTRVQNMLISGYLILRKKFRVHFSPLLFFSLICRLENLDWLLLMAVYDKSTIDIALGGGGCDPGGPREVTLPTSTGEGVPEVGGGEDGGDKMAGGGEVLIREGEVLAKVGDGKEKNRKLAIYKEGEGKCYILLGRKKVYVGPDNISVITNNHHSHAIRIGNSKSDDDLIKIRAVSGEDNDTLAWHNVISETAGIPVLSEQSFGSFPKINSEIQGPPPTPATALDPPPDRFKAESSARKIKYACFGIALSALWYILYMRRKRLKAESSSKKAM
ncbi:hypothetical protein AAMO2058_001675400 [Amorphochlora amoebiformis]